VRLIIAVVESRHVPALRKALTDAGRSATLLASTGGFLRRGNTTFFLAVPDEEVEDAVALLRKVAAGPTASPAGPVYSHVFVVPQSGFRKF
jgi:uncharacterized protein YaaQ